MTPTIHRVAREAIELVRVGYAPSDAIDMACNNVERRGSFGRTKLSSAERERVEDLVTADDPR